MYDQKCPKVKSSNFFKFKIEISSYLRLKFFDYLCVA